MHGKCSDTVFKAPNEQQACNFEQIMCHISDKAGEILYNSPSF